MEIIECILMQLIWDYYIFEMVMYYKEEEIVKFNSKSYNYIYCLTAFFMNLLAILDLDIKASFDK